MINTVLDTSGDGTNKACLLVCREVYLVRFDWKVLDREEHRLVTGLVNDIIRLNISVRVRIGVPVKVCMAMIQA